MVGVHYVVLLRWNLKKNKILSMLLLLECLVCHLKKSTKGDNKPCQLFHSNYSPHDIMQENCNIA